MAHTCLQTFYVIRPERFNFSRSGINIDLTELKVGNDGGQENKWRTEVLRYVSIRGWMRRIQPMPISYHLSKIEGLTV
jgi:hypothetical protein